MYINKLGKKSESPMGFEPMTFRKYQVDAVPSQLQGL